jgi:ArsR family transcriptional regulator
VSTKTAKDTPFITPAMQDFLASIGALNDETRVLLLRFLDEHGALCVCDLQASLGMIQSRLSRHLKILKEAGFLRVERKGTWAYYSVRDPLDRFRAAALEEIRYLGIVLPELVKLSDSDAGCTVP